MTEQLDFEGKTLTRTSDPATSEAAALDPGVILQAKTDEALCYRYLLAAPTGLTNDELSALIESNYHRLLPPNQVATRTKTLRDGGLVRFNGQRRATRRGRSAMVQVAVETGGDDDECAYCVESRRLGIKGCMKHYPIGGDDE